MSVYSLSRSFQIQAWMNWLEETWVCGEERRWILQSFVHHGLVPLLARKGYVLACPANALVATIARELFQIRDGKRPNRRWHSAILNTNYEEEAEEDGGLASASSRSSSRSSSRRDNKVAKDLAP